MKATVLTMALFLLVSLETTEQTSPPQPAQAAASELGKWWKNSEIALKLQLQDKQASRIEKTFNSFRPELASLSATLKTQEDRLREMMKIEPIDESKIRALADAVADARAALERKNSSMMLAIRKDLTKEQWATLDEIRQQRASGLQSPAPSPKTLIKSGEKIYTFKDGLTTLPKCVYQPMPSYTQEARDAGIEGIILLQGIIRKNGRITDLKVLQGLGYGLDESAINTLWEKWRFEPGILNGQPVDVMANIEVSFRLY